MTLDEGVRRFKITWLRLALEAHEGNVRQTALALGIRPSLLEYWLRRLDLVDYGRRLRRRRDWWLVSVCVEVVAFTAMVVYAASPLM